MIEVSKGVYGAECERDGLFTFKVEIPFFGVDSGFFGDFLFCTPGGIEEPFEDAAVYAYCPGVC